MHNPLWAIISRGCLTQREVCPDLPEDATGLPTVTAAPCAGPGCGQCAAVCPTHAITVTSDEAGGVVVLDRGRCLGCQACVEACPAQTIVPDLSTRTTVRTRSELVLTNRPVTAPSTLPPDARFHRSLHVREVSTGSNATPSMRRS